MKLIEEVGLVSYTQKNGTFQKNSSGKFECPVCHELVIRPLAKGERNKSCGKKECVDAMRVSKNQFSERGPLKHYSGELYPSNKKSKLHRLYSVWIGMKKRCYDTSQDKNNSYHEKDITVCDQWINSFDNFYEDMGKEYFELKDKADGSRALTPSIDRIDANGNYSPENCQWITYSENSSKDKRIKVVRMDFNGEILATYASATEAANTFKSQMGCRMMSPGVPHILECCRGTRGEHVGYKWAFATDKERMQIASI